MRTPANHEVFNFVVLRFVFLFVFVDTGLCKEYQSDICQNGNRKKGTYALRQNCLLKFKFKWLTNWIE